MDAFERTLALEHKEKSVAACLHQARAIDYRRLSSKLGTTDTNDFQRISEGFCRLYNIPHSFE